MWKHHLETLRRKTPLRVIHSTGPEHTARLLLSLYKWWAVGGGWDQHKSHTGVHIPPDPYVHTNTLPVYRRTVLKVAQPLPGVRDVLAERVAVVFQTVKDMVEAGVGDWEKVEGIGKAKAVGIVSAIHGPGAHGSGMGVTALPGKAETHNTRDKGKAK
jgi:ERCC4-type nuclease